MNAIASKFLVRVSRTRRSVKVAIFRYKIKKKIISWERHCPLHRPLPQWGRWPPLHMPLPRRAALGVSILAPTALEVGAIRRLVLIASRLSFFRYFRWYRRRPCSRDVQPLNADVDCRHYDSQRRSNIAPAKSKSPVVSVDVTVYQHAAHDNLPPYFAGQDQSIKIK